LIEARWIAEKEVDELFLSAFVGDFGRIVRRRLEIKCPDNPVSDPYPVADVDAAARHLLADGMVYDCRVVHSELPVVKRDRHRCWFCSGDHAMSWCVERAAYERAGKIIVFNGRVFMSDGSDVPSGTQRGMNIRERVDEALSARDKSIYQQTSGRAEIRNPRTQSVDACGRHFAKTRCRNRLFTDLLSKPVESIRDPGIHRVEELEVSGAAQRTAGASPTESEQARK